jgi:hypothetical protein
MSIRRLSMRLSGRGASDALDVPQEVEHLLGILQVSASSAAMRA